MEGQMTVWDYLKTLEPQREPNDSICEGCKWRKHAGRLLDVHECGDTWVYCCPGTACANWQTGTPLNLSAHDRKPYCYNRDFLPLMEYLLPLVEAEYDVEFTRKEWQPGSVEWVFKYKKCTFSLDECTYMGTDKRFVGFSWECPNRSEGFSSPCDNLFEVFRAMDRAFERTEGKQWKIS